LRDFFVFDQLLEEFKHVSDEMKKKAQKNMCGYNLTIVSKSP